MRMTFDLRKEVEQRINTVFGQKVDTKKLWIELSTDYSEEFIDLYTRWSIKGEMVKIDGFYGKYDIDKGKVILYLPVIAEPCVSKIFPFDYFIRVVLYYEVSQWVCRTMETRAGMFPKEQFSKTGNDFRNFVAMMFAYELVKFDNDLIDCLKMIVESLTDDYGLWLTFIEKNDATCYLPGLSIYEITRLISNVQYYQMEDVSRDYILTFSIEQMFKQLPPFLRFYPKLSEIIEVVCLTHHPLNQFPAVFINGNRHRFSITAA
jgi:hypothetical protein